MDTIRQSSNRRHEALAPFSRDHYVGLVQARHLVQASEGDARERNRAKAEFLVAWQKDIFIHFQDEERLLLSLMSENDRRRMIAEHRRLEELVSELDRERRDAAPRRELLAEIGTLLNQHIRWEERDVFNRMQEGIDQAALEELQDSTAEIEASRDRKGSVSNSGSD